MIHNNYFSRIATPAKFSATKFRQKTEGTQKSIKDKKQQLQRKRHIQHPRSRISYHTIPYQIMTTMSDDELILIEEQARKLTIVELKKCALVAKQTGKLDTAIEHLKQAKKIENEERRRQRKSQDTTTTSSDSDEESFATTLPIFWKKVALLCKQSGALNKAKEALMYSKELEKKQEHENENEVAATANNNNNNSSDEGVVSQEEIIPPPLQSLTSPESQSYPTIHEQAVSTFVTITTTETPPLVPVVVVDDSIEPPLPPPPSYENINSSTTTTAAEMSMSSLPLPPPPLPPPPPPPSYDNISNSPSRSISNEKMMQKVDGEKEKDDEEEEEEAAMLARFRKKKEDTIPDAVVKDDIVEEEVVVQEEEKNVAVVVAAAAAEGVVVSFTDEEMMDEEMMIELSELGDDDMTTSSIPTQEEYAAKVFEYKKLALKYKKEGNIPIAMQYLQQAKQFEKVATVLKDSMNTTGGGSSGSDSNNNETQQQQQQQQNGLSSSNWMETLNAEESDLLGELFDDDNNNNNNCGGGDGDGDGGDIDDTKGITTKTGTGTDRLTIEDIDDMEDDNDIIELVEMMGNIHALPTVEELTAMITEHKQNALKYKQDGNIEEAKRSLIQSKKAKFQAMRLAEIYRKLEIRKQKSGGESEGGDDDDSNKVNEGNGGSEELISMDALEALMDGSHITSVPSPTPGPKQPNAVIIDPWLLKPSAEIKVEVIRLKNNKDVKEATRLLQLFKQKLAQEQKEIETAKCSKMIDMIQQRINASEVQIKLWQYYNWFKDVAESSSSSVGKTQYVEWIQFQKVCQKAIHTINTEGSNSVTISPRIVVGDGGGGGGGDSVNVVKKKKMYTLEDDIISLVESCTNEDHKSVATTAADDDDASSGANGGGGGGSSIDDNSLEVTVMGLFEMDKNEKLQKILTKQQPKSTIKNKAAATAATSMPSSSTSPFPPNLKINAKLQLPIYPDDPSKPVYMDFQPSHSSLSRSGRLSSFKYDFDPTSTLSRQQIVLPRNDPKQERTLLRRIETKTIQLSIFYDTHNQKVKPQDAIAAMEAAKNEAATNAVAASKKKSWFFGKGKEMEPSSKVNGDGSGGGVDDKDIFLGKVTIEFHPLLSRGCITGDYPIMTNAKSLGGILRVAIRTKPALDPDKYEGVLPLMSVEEDDPSSSSSFIGTYKKGLSFTFNNKTKIDGNDDDEKTSIAAIKRDGELSSSPSQQSDTPQKIATTTKAE